MGSDSWDSDFGEPLVKRPEWIKTVTRRIKEGIAPRLAFEEQWPLKATTRDMDTVKAIEALVWLRESSYDYVVYFAKPCTHQGCDWARNGWFHSKSCRQTHNEMAKFYGLLEGSTTLPTVALFSVRFRDQPALAAFTMLWG